MFKSHVADTCTLPRRINKSLNEVSILLEFLKRERDNEQRLPLVFFHLDLSFHISRTRTLIRNCYISDVISISLIVFMACAEKFYSVLLRHCPLLDLPVEKQHGRPKGDPAILSVAKDTSQL